MKLLDSFRKHVYLTPFGLWLMLDAALFEEVEVNSYKKHEPNPGPIRNTLWNIKVAQIIISLISSKKETNIVISCSFYVFFFWG